MDPTLIERETGGWLAVTPPGKSPSIAVTATSATEAQEAFGSAWASWQALLAASRDQSRTRNGQSPGG
jgi:hypothetical protein